MTHTITDGIHEGRRVTLNPTGHPKGFTFVTGADGQAFYVRTRYLEEEPEPKRKRKAKAPKASQ